MTAGDRTVLFVTYEFPPTGGAGVQRLAKFARFLPSHGWKPVVVSAEHVSGRNFDETLAEDVAGVRVVRTPARPVNAWISRALGFARGVRSRLRSRGSAGTGAAGSSGAAGGAALAHASRVAATGRAGRTEQLTRLLTVPDFAMLWVGPAVRAGIRLGRETGASVVFASGPPFSVLVAGSRIARALGVPFVADYRDAWRDNPNNTSYPSEWHRSRSLSLERSVLATATGVTTAHPIADEIRELGGPEPRVIPNGFDPADLPKWSASPEPWLQVTFMGTFYSVNDPLPVFQALKSVREGAAGPAQDVRLRIVGSWAPHVEAVVAELGLDDAVEFQRYLPHHQALALLASSDVGLVVYADLPQLRASTPAKLYEYLGIGLPILFVGPTEGAAPGLVREAEAGRVAPYSDSSAIAEALAHFSAQKAAGTLGAVLRHDVVDRYDRRSQAEQLASVLEEVVGE